MSASELFSLLPLILVSITLLSLMMIIALKRDPQLSFQASMIGLGAAFVSLFVVAGDLPQQVTPLLLIDDYALFFMGLMLLTALLLLPLSHEYWSHHNQISDEFCLLYLISVLGALVLVASNHFGTFFLGLELLTLPLIVMVGYPFFTAYSASLEAAVKYLILSGAASATLLFGIALVYTQTGSLDFAPFAAVITGDEGSEGLLMKAGMMLIIVGVCFKLSLVPFHLWTPDVYQGAPLPATAFLATIAKGSVFALLLRYYLSGEIFLTDSLVWSIAAIAVASMLVGNLLALLQNSLKRLLAYSSVAHFGYLLVALLAVSQSVGADIAIEAVSYYLVAYLISTLAAFAVLIRLPELAESTDTPTLEQLRGLLWRQPLLAIIMTLAMLSLAGIPLTAGFIGKFYIFAAAVEEALWGILLVAIVGSGIGLFYYLRVILIMTRSHPQHEPAEPQRMDINSQLVLGVVTLLILFLGVYPAPLIDLIRNLTLSLV